MSIQRKNYLWRTIGQLLLLFVVVLFVGAVKSVNAKEEKKKNKKNDAKEVSLPSKLVPSDDSSKEISDVYFGDDEEWENSIDREDKDIIVLRGEGNISGEDVTVNCVYDINDGSMTGRYRHKNGTNLDLNGKVSSDGEELEIHLGHQSDNTFSKWILYPVNDETSEGVYVYNGYWGKSKKPSDITFTVVE